MAIWNKIWTFGIFYDHLVHFVFIWYIFSGFVIMHQENSGNPGPLGENSPNLVTLKGTRQRRQIV
jgi:hypothetical protein